MYHLILEESNDSSTPYAFTQSIPHPSIGTFYNSPNSNWLIDTRYHFMNNQPNGKGFFLGFQYSSQNLKAKTGIGEILGNQLNLNQFRFLVGIDYFLSPYKISGGLILGSRSYHDSTEVKIYSFEGMNIYKGQYNYRPTFELGVNCGIDLTLVQSIISIGIEGEIAYGFAKRDKITFTSLDNEIIRFKPVGDIEIHDLIVGIKINLIYTIRI